jgi:RNA polymerase sigma factor (sigma-70 family)
VVRRDQEFSTWARDETPALLRRARLLCLDAQLAEDLVQDTLVRLYLSWSRIDRDANPVGYAHRTMFHHFVSGRRRRSSQERPVAEPEDRPGTARASSTDAVNLRLDLRAALGSLSAVERCVVMARYVDDLSVADTARLFDRKESWVKSVTHDAVLKLRRSPSLIDDLSR